MHESSFLTRMNALIRSFGERIGIPALVFDESGMLVLTIDGKKYLLAASEQYGSVAIVRRLLSMPQDGNERLRLLAAIAEKNCFYLGTDGGIIGTRENAMFYTFSIPADPLDAAALEQGITAALNFCDDLVKELSEGSAPAEAETFSDADLMNAYAAVSLRV